MDAPRSNYDYDRLIHLDVMRGIFLCVIIIDHLQRFPGFLDLFTGRGLLWASAAEGFFFISGMMLGLVRGRREVNKPLHDVVRSLLSRASLLYVWNVILTIIFTLAAWLFASYSGVKPGYIEHTTLGGMIQEVFTLKYTYGWADFLQYYSLFIAFSPIAIWLLRRGQWLIVLFMTCGVWIVSGNNFYLSWQLLFYMGSVAGYYLPDFEKYIMSKKGNSKRIFTYAVLAFSILTYLISQVLTLGLPFLENKHITSLPFNLTIDQLKLISTRYASYFDKTSLGIGRVLIFLLWFTALYFLSYRLSRKFKNNILLSNIIKLGQNSLYVYIAHSFVLFFLDILIPGTYPILINICIDIGVIMFLVLLVHYRVGFKFIPR